MHLLLPLFILSLPPAASIDLEAPEAVEIYRCDFTHQQLAGEVRPADVNYDTWPDHWTRRRDKNHPAFLKIGIVSGDIADVRPVADSPHEPRWLRVGLDGGAAAVYSPAVEVSPHFAYRLEVRLRTRDLRHDEVYCSLTFHDAQERPLERYESPRLRRADDWSIVQIGPLAPRSDDVRRAVVGLHVAPTAKADLTGAVGFDDIRLARLPRVTFTANSPHHVYTDPQAIILTCQTSGASEPDPGFRLRVYDINGQVVDESSQRIGGKPIAPAGDAAAGAAYAGALRWSPRITEPGYYRAEAEMHTRQGVAHRRSLSLAVVREPQSHGMRAMTSGAFGWSLPPGNDPLPLEALASLTLQAGVQWVKLPAWFPAQDQDRGDRLAKFVDRVEQAGVTVVGVLDQPPPEDRPLFKDEGPLVIASVFAQPEAWRASVDPVMTRLTPIIRWWQLGADHDASFAGQSGLETTIEEIRRGLTQYGQNVQLGFAWRWLDDAPTGSTRKPPWDFLSYSLDPAAPPFTGAELTRHVQDAKSAREQRWAAVQPLPKNDYDLPTRARDLVERMVAAKVGGAAVTFAPRPFDPESGLMNADGTPGELFLAWRTTALLLAGGEYLGSIELPEGSTNHVFARGEESVMVLWNERPVRETLYLGEDVRQIDLWDRAIMPPVSDGAQTLEVGPLPTLVTGVHTAIARWRMSFRIEDPRLASVFGRPQRLEYQIQNPFPLGVNGRVVFHTPVTWDVQHHDAPVKLAADELRTDALGVTLLPTASSGPQRVQVDFAITADREYRFRTWRTIDIGLSDVAIEAHTRLDEEGRLVVEQRFVNRSAEPVSFLCQLFAPGRPRVRRPVLDVAPGETTILHYFPDGAELIGQFLMLRAEEIRGERVLNYRFEAR